MIEVPEVIEAAEKLNTVLGKPGPHEPGSGWDSISRRMDDVTRNKLHELYGII